MARDRLWFRFGGRRRASTSHALEIFAARWTTDCGSLTPQQNERAEGTGRCRQRYRPLSSRRAFVVAGPRHWWRGSGRSVPAPRPDPPSGASRHERRQSDLDGPIVPTHIAQVPGIFDHRCDRPPSALGADVASSARRLRDEHRGFHAAGRPALPATAGSGRHETCGSDDTDGSDVSRGSERLADENHGFHAVEAADRLTEPQPVGHDHRRPLLLPQHAFAASAVAVVYKGCRPDTARRFDVSEIAGRQLHRD
jgi:hypothetical protein